MMSIILNRPKALNSLNPQMIRLIREALEEASNDKRFQFVLLYAQEEKGFCAGGDIKELARAVREQHIDEALHFLRQEYELDLFIHEFSRPVLVMADGITMGGGLGLCAGADLVLATERTRMAMPESRIGFFPDVGATGWMFSKTPKGYPEYLGLTGHEMHGEECVRLGMATDLVAASNLPSVIQTLEDPSSFDRRIDNADQIREKLKPFFKPTPSYHPDKDQWVAAYFSGQDSVIGIADSLRQCNLYQELCQGVFTSLAERSPTSLVLTLTLLRRNASLPMPHVFENDLRAAQFILSHPDFLEGIRSRLIDKDNQPQWKPSRLEEVDLKGLSLV
jgi:enoyl-CoA hydratase/carnithine racemase